MLALAYSANASVLPISALQALSLQQLPAAVNIAESPLALRLASPLSGLSVIQPQAISLSQGLAAHTLVGPQIVNGVHLQNARIAPVTAIASSVIPSPWNYQVAAPVAVRTIAAPIAVAAAEG